jgi:hypothetical protein
MPSARAIFQAHVDGMTAVAMSPLSIPFSFAWTMEDSASDFDLIDLPTGTTMFTKPAKATMLCIEPPATNATPLVLVGASGDTGVALSPNSATVLAVVTTPIGIKLTAAVPNVRLSWL